MLVDVTELTANEQYGIAFLMQRENQNITSQNAYAAQYNSTRPVNAPEMEIKPLYTLQAFAEKVLREQAQAAYVQLENYKWDMAKPLFNSAEPEVREQVLTLLNVPDVIQG